MSKRIDWTETERESVFRQAQQIIDNNPKGKTLFLNALFQSAQNILPVERHRRFHSVTITLINKQFKKCQNKQDPKPVTKKLGRPSKANAVRVSYALNFCPKCGNPTGTCGKCGFDLRTVKFD